LSISAWYVLPCLSRGSQELRRPSRVRTHEGFKRFGNVDALAGIEPVVVPDVKPAVVNSGRPLALLLKERRRLKANICAVHSGVAYLAEPEK
jgi:hypothetical protein